MLAQPAGNSQGGRLVPGAEGLSVGLPERLPEGLPEAAIQYTKDCFYEGQYLETGEKKVRHGRGRLTHVSHFHSRRFEESYSGEWRDDLKHGSGRYSYINGAEYDGQWANDLQEGFGTYMFPDGSFYEGEWKGHLMHGQGRYVDTKGRLWDGFFCNGTFDSKNQTQLKKKAAKAELVTKIGHKVADWVRGIAAALEKDKRTFKEMLKKSLASETAPETAALFAEKLVKVEDRKADVWWV